MEQKNENFLCYSPTRLSFILFLCIKRKKYILQRVFCKPQQWNFHLLLALVFFLCLLRPSEQSRFERIQFSEKKAHSISQFLAD
jgi:hypothetical protein